MTNFKASGCRESKSEGSVQDVQGLGATCGKEQAICTHGQGMFGLPGAAGDVALPRVKLPKGLAPAALKPGPESSKKLSTPSLNPKP